MGLNPVGLESCIHNIGMDGQTDGWRLLNTHTHHTGTGAGVGICIYMYVYISQASHGEIGSAVYGIEALVGVSNKRNVLCRKHLLCRLRLFLHIDLHTTHTHAIYQSF